MQLPVTKERVVELLTEARARTLLLISGISEEDLRRQHDPLMGPIIWDLGHIAHFEELWLLSNLEGEIEFGEMPGMFNPFDNPRSVRGALQLPDLSDTLSMLSETRARVIAALRMADFASSNPLLRDAYVYNMVLQHEYQHNETILQTMQLKQGDAYRAPRAISFADAGARSSVRASNASDASDMVHFAGGRVLLGTTDRSAAYDNERPQHEITLGAFDIDRHAVTCAEYLAFIEAGGYTQRAHWSDAGWKWRAENNATAPKYWERTQRGWLIRRYDRWDTADRDVPVCHVSYYEAEAYARSRGKRLPTEAEWEIACTWDPVSATKSVFPWGNDAVTVMHANVDQLAFAPAPTGTFDLNISPIGCYGMIGDVWEWTSTDFAPHPGYETFPYAEYSEVFFGSEYKVLRGGSWATRPGAIRGTFRNWDYPIRRQIFSGFRCAR